MNDFYATLDLNISSLTPRSVKLLAFLQAHADKKGVSFWSKRKTCEALGISESTYARALRELTREGLAEVKPRFDENGRQRSNTYRVLNTKGLKYRADMDDVEKLRHREVKVGRVHLIDADRIDMSGEVSYHAVENSKLSKPEVMELLQYPIGVTLEADGRYRVFLGAYRFWYLRECLHWTKIPCFVYKIKRQIRDPRERRRREIYRRQQAAESPRIRLQLYENYYKLLKGMKDAGEIKGGLQTRLMQLLGVSERTVRIYKQLSEHLTGREKQHLMRGKLPFVQARALAAERNQKAAMLPDFEEAEDNKDKNLPANNGE